RCCATASASPWSACRATLCSRPRQRLKSSGPRASASTTWFFARSPGPNEMESTMRLFSRLAGATAAATICLLTPLALAKTSIVVTATQIFGTIDPAKIKDYTEYMAAANLYEGLTTVDSKGKVLPLLAEKWE